MIKEQDQTFYGLATQLTLYQTRQDRYAGEIEETSATLAQLLTDMIAQGREQDIFPLLGPLPHASLLPLLPGASHIAEYTRLLSLLETEQVPRTLPELISHFDHIVILLGRRASGKGTITNIAFQNYGMVGMPTSDWLRAVAAARECPRPFEPIMLRGLGDELREEFGGGVLVTLTLQEYFLKDQRSVVFDGLRSERELQDLAGPNVSLVWVEAPNDVRLQRVLGRARPGDPKTIDKLLEVDTRTLPDAVLLQRMCQTTLVNDTNDMEVLTTRVDAVMSQLGIKKITRIDQT